MNLSLRDRRRALVTGAWTSSLRCLSLGIACLMAPAHVVVAQALEEVVVTAQKREQSVQDVGFSVSAFSAEDIAAFGTDIGSLAGQIPGVEAYGSGTYLQSFFIRGVGLNEFSGNFNAPVAIHVDEVYVSKNWMFARPVFDIARIEALKGPQGTLFGRNTTGGTINYYTQEPTPQFEMSVRAGGDNFERYTLEGVINGPLTDALSGRVSVYRGLGSGGPQKNLFTGKEYGEPDILQVRGQLLWEAGGTSVRVLGYGGTDQSETLGYKGPGIFNNGAPGFCPAALAGQVSFAADTCAKFGGLAAAQGVPQAESEPRDVNTINQNQPPTRDDSFFGGHVRVDHDFGASTLTSLSAFDHYKRDHTEDADGSFLITNDVDWFNDIDVFTQELRLTGDAWSDHMHYVLGVFYEHDDLRQVDSDELNGLSTVNGVTIGNPFGPLPPRLVGEFDQTVDSYALFFNSDFDVSDTVTLTAGVRYTSDSTRIDARTSVGLNDVAGEEDLPRTTLAVVDTLDDKRTDEDVSWRLGATWDVAADVTLYTNITTGFRTGGYSVPFAGTIVQFEPEEIFSAEVGAKSRLFDGQLQLNAAVFRYEYSDLQVNVDDPVSPIVPITRNIGESRTVGAEVEAHWQPVDRFVVRLGYAYLDAEFTDTDRTMTTISTLGPIPLEGKTPVNTPEQQLSGMLRYTQALGGELAIVASTDARYVGKRYLEVTNQPNDLADSYSVVNARLSLVPDSERWTVSVWARNLLDEEYLTYVNNLPGPGFKLDIFGEQRSYGLSVEYAVR